MRGLAEIVRANDDATNARAYQATLAKVYSKLLEATTSDATDPWELMIEARRAIENAMEQTNVC